MSTMVTMTWVRGRTKAFILKCLRNYLEIWLWKTANKNKHTAAENTIWKPSIFTKHTVNNRLQDLSDTLHPQEFVVPSVERPTGKITPLST